MSESPKKTLSLGDRAKKVFIQVRGAGSSQDADSSKFALSSVDSEGGGDFSMGDYPPDGQQPGHFVSQYNARGNHNGQNKGNSNKGGYRKKKPYGQGSYGQDSYNQGFNQDNDSEGDGPQKMRRGPGRRISKEKRGHQMDPALMNKYATLSPALQEKVNATIQIYYQQQMTKVYKGEVDESQNNDEVDHYESEVVYETEIKDEATEQEVVESKVSDNPDKE